MKTDNLANLMRIRALANGEAAMYFYGEIVSSWWDAWDNTDKYPDAVRHALDGLRGETLHIYINSPGGAVFAGIAIFNMLRRYSGRKVVHVDGIAASIASVIAMAGDEIIMPDNTEMMIHMPRIAWADGTAEDLRGMAEALDRAGEMILATYTARLRMPDDVEKVKWLMEKESYLSAKETAALFAGVSVASPLALVARVKDAGRIYGAAVENERLKLLELAKK